jgi:hypothetical protein
LPPPRSPGKIRSSHKFRKSRSGNHEAGKVCPAAMDCAPLTSIMPPCEIEETRMGDNALAKRNLIQVLVPSSISAALREAAAHELTSHSEYVRRAVIERLRSDGHDPARFAPAQPSAVA